VGVELEIGNRRRRTAEEREQLNMQLIAIVHESRPVSVRNVFYQMTNPRLPIYIPKTDAGYNQVAWDLMRLRRRGLIDYEDIVDSTRSGRHVPAFADAGEFMKWIVGYYRQDLWSESEVWPIVLVESRSIAGMIEGDLARLGVSLYPLGGFSSISLMYELAMRINDHHQYRKVRLIYIGDYDPAGVMIDRSAEKEVRYHIVDEVDLEVVRLAVTEKQIAQYDLPDKPRKQKSRVAMHIQRTVEAEAMPANLLRELLSNSITKLLPKSALSEASLSEERTRAALLKVRVKVR
jgi:hypothetical protein